MVRLMLDLQDAWRRLTPWFAERKLSVTLRLRQLGAERERTNDVCPLPYREFLNNLVEVQDGDIDHEVLQQQLEERLSQLGAQEKQHRESYQQNCRQLDATHGYCSWKVESVGAALKVAAGHRQRLEKELGRSCQVRIGLKTFVALLAGLAITIALLTQPWFHYALDHHVWGWGAAIMVGAAIAVEAKLVGELVRRSISQAPARMSRQDVLLVVGDTFVAMVLLCLTVWLPELTNYLARVGYVPSPSTIPSPQFDALITLSIGLSLFALGVSASVWAHDAEPILAQCSREEQILQRRLFSLLRHVHRQKTRGQKRSAQAIRSTTAEIALIKRYIQALQYCAKPAPSTDAETLTDEHGVEPVNPDEPVAYKKDTVTLAVEYWRTQRVLKQLLRGLDDSKKALYTNQLGRLQQSVENVLTHSGLWIVNVEGHEYDPGMAAEPLNIGEFDVLDTLFVVRMLDPVIMGTEGIEKTGTVMLGKDESCSNTSV